MKKLLCLSTLVFLLAVQTTWAQIPKTIQGVALDSKGIPLPDSPKSITFNIYEFIDSITPLWSEQQSVPIKDGRFTATLGSVNPLDLPGDEVYWLGLKIGEGKELIPRLKLTPGADSLLPEAVADISDSSGVKVTSLVVNNLDEAYDGGGAGLGRTITADAGAVNIAGPDGLTVNGNVGIGTTTPGAVLDIEPSSTVSTPVLETAGTSSNNKFINFTGINTDNSTNARGLFVNTTMQGSGNGLGVFGINGVIRPSGAVGTAYGTINNATLGNSSSDITQFFSNFYRYDIAAAYTGTISKAVALRLDAPLITGTPATESFGISIGNQGGTGTTTTYGMRIENQTGSTNNWGLYIDGSSLNNFFEGNLGIGTDTPASKLHVVSTGSPDLKIEETAANSSAQISLQNVAREWWVQADASPDLFSIEDRTAGNVIHFAIEGGTGNVGIGTTTPGARLVVSSTTGTNLIEAYDGTNLVFRVERTTGDVFADGSFNSGGADVAEYVNTSETVEPGDVIEIDPNNPGQFRKAREAMSPRVAGIITTEPGVVLGGNSIRGKNGDKHPAVALAGRVPVKVMAKFGAIEIGDLLVSSPFPGYAMKCPERSECIGAIIGKAMEPLDEGVGKIMVQVMLR